MARIARWLGALLCAAPALALAHHGKDFLIVESYEVPPPGEFFVLASGQYSRDDGAAETELEPAALVGITHHLSGEVHVHLLREPGASSLKTEAIAPSLQVQLTDADAKPPVDLGAAVEYEFGRGATPDRLELRGIAEKTVGRSRAALNFFGEHESGATARYGYAAAYRYEWSDSLAFGVETQGHFDAPQGNEALLGMYVEPFEVLTIKAGAGAGFGSGAPDLSLRAGLVWRF